MELEICCATREEVPCGPWEEQHMKEAELLHFKGAGAYNDVQMTEVNLV